MNHFETETLFWYQEGLLEGEVASQVRRHLAECPECQHRAQMAKTFDARLTAEWLGTRLGQVVTEEWGCPGPEEWGRLFLEEVTDEAERRHLEAHRAACSDCRDTFGKMEQAFGALHRADPLTTFHRAPSDRPWWEPVRSFLGLTPWPVWAGATVAVAIAFVAGLIVYPALFGPMSPQPLPGVIRIAKPPFTPQPELPAFGIGPAYKAEAEKQFQEAMALYAEPDFPDRAIQKLRQAVAIDPTHDQAQFWLGIAYLLKDDTRAAIPPLEEAVRLASGKAEYKQCLVWAYLKLGENAKALDLQTELLKRR